MHIVMTRREALDVPDGINIFLFSMAEALQEEGHRVSMVSTTATDADKIQQYFAPKQMPGIVALGNHRDVNYRKALTTWIQHGRKAIGALAPDLVVINGAVPVRLPGLTCTVSHDIEKRFKHPLLRNAYKRWCYARTDLIVATCDEVRDALADDLSVAPGKISVIPTCVRLETYKNLPYEQREDAVLHMGTVFYKNPMATLRAFAHAARPGRKLYLTGKVTPEISSYVSSLPSQIRECIQLVGYVSSERLLELLGSVKVISVPSVYNVAVASPTVIEGLASGTPVVGTSSISKQVLEDGGNGYVRDPGNDQQVGQAFNRLLSDGETWKKLAGRALETAERFCSRRVARMYVELANAHGKGARNSAKYEASQSGMPKGATV